MDLSINSRVVARDHVSCKLEDEAVILNLDDCTYYGLEDDIITPPHRIDRGFMAVPEEPGLGVNVDEAKLTRYRV